MIIESKGEKYSILYKFYKAKKSLKIYDFEVQGISIVSTYRSQNSQILSNGNMEDLLRMMSGKDGNDTEDVPE